MYCSQNNKPHHIDFDDQYPVWGTVGNKLVKTASLDQIQMAKQVLDHMIPAGFELSQQGLVSHYQGPVHEPIEGVLLRFTAAGNVCLGGEHVSAVVDLDVGHIVGFCRMLPDCEGSITERVEPHIALQKAFEFLKKEAPDLVTIDDCPEFSYPEDYLGGGISFSDAPIDLGCVSLLWIDGHTEKFHDTITRPDTYGMKVKMRFNDNSERYAWVIVDKNSEPHVFERNVFWDFNKMQRETQMWLHDGWIMSHDIF